MLPIPLINYPELVLAIGVIVIMVKVADSENRSPLLWGSLTFVTVFAAVWYLGSPYWRVLLAGGLMLAAMTAVKMASKDSP